MADPFLAEVRIFGFNFPPVGWAECDGQTMPLSQNTALFALLGTTYGGNGQSTFALPDLQGRAPMHPGQGQGLSLRDLGESGGVESVTLTPSEIPVHTHRLRASGASGDNPNPQGNTLARYSNVYHSDATQNITQKAAESLPPAGGGLPHTNMQPYLAFTFCIAIQGIFPPAP